MAAFSRKKPTSPWEQYFYRSRKKISAVHYFSDVYLIGTRRQSFFFLFCITGGHFCVKSNQITFCFSLFFASLRFSPRTRDWNKNQKSLLWKGALKKCCWKKPKMIYKKCLTPIRSYDRIRYFKSEAFYHGFSHVLILLCLHCFNISYNDKNLILNFFVFLDLQRVQGTTVRL